MNGKCTKGERRTGNVSRCHCKRRGRRGIHEEVEKRRGNRWKRDIDAPNERGWKEVMK